MINASSGAKNAEITNYHAPLDFEEYLWARGYGEDAVSALRGYLDR